MLSEAIVSARKPQKVSQTTLKWTKLVCYRCSAHYILGERTGSGEGRLEHILEVTRKPIEWLIPTKLVLTGGVIKHAYLEHCVASAPNSCTNSAHQQPRDQQFVCYRGNLAVHGRFMGVSCVWWTAFCCLKNKLGGTEEVDVERGGEQKTEHV